MSITKRKKNVYRFVTAAPPDPVTGKRRQLTATFHGSAADAKIAHAEWLIEVGAATKINGTSTSLTYAELMVRYLHHLEGRIEDRTLENRKRDAKLHLLPALGHIPVRDLKVDHFDDLYSELGKRLAPSTIINVHTLACSSLKQAMKWEWVNRNVAKLATPPPNHKKDPYSPPSEDVYRLLDHLMATDFPLFVFTDLVAMTGMRPAEACALRWQDVDLDAGTIDINGSIARTYRRDRKDTKTHRDRSIHIDQALVDLLEKWRVETNHLPPQKYLFSNEVSHTLPWRPNGCSTRLKAHRDALGITSAVTYRGLRHHVATHLIANGVDVVTVAKRLGHANPAMTLSVYASAVPKNDKAAAELLRRMRKEDDGRNPDIDG